MQYTPLYNQLYNDDATKFIWEEPGGPKSNSPSGAGYFVNGLKMKATLIQMAEIVDRHKETLAPVRVFTEQAVQVTSGQAVNAPDVDQTPALPPPPPPPSLRNESSVNLPITALVEE